MRTLVEGSKKLSRKAVRKAFINSSDYNCREGREAYKSFEAWAKSSFSWQDEIFITPEWVFWKQWLKDKPEVQEWLVDHNFAEWK